VDDRATAGLTHPRRHLLAGADGGHDVDAQGRFPGGAVVGHHDPARVVDQDVHAAQAAACGVEEVVQGLGLADVTHRSERGNGPGAQLHFDLAQRCLIARTNGDAGPLVGQAQCDRAADTPAAAGDNRGLSL
jgi:hypothetical protein